jgi:hypothetical protein
VFDSVKRNKRKLFDELQAFDSIESSRALVEEECLDSRIRLGESGVMCKIDLEKAYDHLN